MGPPYILNLGYPSQSELLFPLVCEVSFNMESMLSELSQKERTSIERLHSSVEYKVTEWETNTQE